MRVTFLAVATIISLVMLVPAGAAAGSWEQEYTPDAYTLALWHSDEGTGTIAQDDSGNGNDAFISGATWVSHVWPDGDVNGALRFRDTGIAYGIPGSFDDQAGTDITVEAWVYWEGPHPQTYSDSSYILDARTLGPPNGGFILCLDVDGKVCFRTFYGYTSNPWSAQQVISQGVVPPGVWTHVAGVLDYTNRELRVYINGMEDTSATAVEPYWKGVAPAAIGNNRWAPGDNEWAPFNGRIDELRVSDVVRNFGGGAEEPLYPEPLPSSGKGRELARVLVSNVNWGIASGKGYLLDEKKRDELGKKVGAVLKPLGSPSLIAPKDAPEAQQKIAHASRFLTKVSNPNCYLTENRYNFLGAASRLLEYPDVDFTVTITPPADPTDQGTIAFDGTSSTGGVHILIGWWWCGSMMWFCMF